MAPLWAHRFALLVSFMTLVLLSAGALVTGTGSGLAVPDWPLSFGTFFPPMIGGVLYEHGHRLIAGSVAILMVGLALVLWLKEPRAWVRWIALFAVFVVFFQAALGGLTVILRLPPSVSVSHACLAQIFFTLTVILSLVTSPVWASAPRPLAKESGAWISLPALCVLLNVMFFLQLVLGAVTRHLKAGLAIPDFPTVFGGVLPPVFTVPVTVHFLHRLGAFTLVGLVAWVAARLLRRHEEQLGLVAWGGGLAGLVAIQIFLGGIVIWTRRPIPLTTMHLVVGALCLATSVALTFQVFRAAGFRFPMASRVGSVPALGGAV